jgi:hypothetical protein
MLKNNNINFLHPIHVFDEDTDTWHCAFFVTYPGLVPPLGAPPGIDCIRKCAHYLQLFPRIMRFVIFFAGARFQTRLGNCRIYTSNRASHPDELWGLGNRKISSDLKECALRLWNTGWDIEDIYNALGVSRASIYRWESIFAEYGTGQPSPVANTWPRASHPHPCSHDSLRGVVCQRIRPKVGLMQDQLTCGAV